MFSNNTVSLVGIFPARSLFSLVRSALENTSLLKLVEPILKVNCPSVLLPGKVTLLVAS